MSKNVTKYLSSGFRIWLWMVLFTIVISVMCLFIYIVLVVNIPPDLSSPEIFATTVVPFIGVWIVVTVLTSVLIWIALGWSAHRVVKR